MKRLKSGSVRGKVTADESRFVVEDPSGNRIVLRVG